MNAQNPVERLLTSTQELREQQDRLLETVDDLSQSLGKVLTSLAERPVGGPWSWRHLDAYERQALLMEVRDWVDWTITRYEVTETIKPCWYRHPPVLLELIAVYVAWREAYGPRPPGAFTSDLTAWHDRWWWPMVTRAKRHDWMSGCTGGTHQEHGDRDGASTDSNFARATDEYLEGLPEPRSREQVERLVAADLGEWLDEEDPQSAFKAEDGVWWAVLYNTPDGRWVPRPTGTVTDELDEQLQRKHDTINEGRTP